VQEGIGFSVRLRLPRKTDSAEIIDRISSIDGVTLVDEE
jgi:hypothetical protein